MDMKWPHGHDKLKVFFKEANNFHPTIKFSAEVSKNKHVFLDKKSKLAGDTIEVDSTPNLLIYSSTLSKNDTFEHRTQELAYHLTKTGLQATRDCKFNLEN